MLGDFIREQREKRSITQKYLASKLGFSCSTYRRIEYGEREIKKSEATKLAEIFGIPIEDFLNSIEEPRKNTGKIKQVFLYVVAEKVLEGIVNQIECVW